jgi:hypothetical protein
MYLLDRFIVAMLAGLAGMPQGPAPGRSAATAAIILRAEFKSHTSLRVSSSQLRFEIADTLDIPRVAIEFSAAARTYRDGEVALTVEPVGSLQGPDSGPPADLMVQYDAEGGRAGSLSDAAPHVVGQWVGGGVREGRVWFTLRGARAPGVYVLALKFALSAP